MPSLSSSMKQGSRGCGETPAPHAELLPRALSAWCGGTRGRSLLLWRVCTVGYLTASQASVQQCPPGAESLGARPPEVTFHDCLTFEVPGCYTHL